MPSDTPPRTVPLPLLTAELLVPLLCWAILRELQVSFAGGGFGNDLLEYFSYAKAWAAGQTPYVDFPVEYPPGALVLFLVPWLMGGRVHFIKAFVGQMVVFDLLTFLLVLRAARELFPLDLRRQRWVAAVYLTTTALLHPVLFGRFDLAPALLTVWALELARRDKSSSAFVLGLGGAVKLWPLVLLPAWLFAAYRREGSQGVLRTGLLAGAGYAAPMALLLPRAGGKVSAFFHFHAARGLQLESTWASCGLLLQRLGLVHAAPVLEFGAWDLQSTASTFLAGLSLPVMAALALWPQWVAMRREATSASAFAGDPAVCAVAASVLGLLLGGKVLSPQFLLWVVPLVALTAANARLLLLGASALTTLLYPVLYESLVAPVAANHGLAVAVLMTRNVLLAMLYVALVRQVGQTPTRAIH